MISFDRAADIYDQTRGFPPGVGERVVTALRDFAGLTAGMPILEIGIGTGRIAGPLAALLGPRHQLTGIDISRKMMARLAANLPPQARRPYLVEADAAHLPFASQTFHAILTIHVLHLLRDWQRVLTDINRVRALGGVLVGGWNDHPDGSSGERISHKFRALAAEHGILAERQGLAEFNEVLLHLPVKRAEEIVAAEWTVERAPRLALQAIAERHFSSAWLVPDDVYPTLYAELEVWAKKEWPDLDQATLETRRFKWMKIEF